MTVSVVLSAVAEVNPRNETDGVLATDAVDFFPMAAVDAGKTVAFASERRALQHVSKGFTSFRDGDVLLAKITPCFENGKISQASVTTPVAFGSTEFHVVRCGARLDSRYLVHFLRRQEIRVDGERKMTGSGGQRRVPRHFLESLEIPLPPLAEQRRIAAILDKADALRSNRQEALAQLDRLAQSIFVEMFGDPVTNPKGWPVVNLRTYLLDVTNGLTRRGNEVESGEHIVLRLRDIRAGSIDFSEPNRITLNEKERAKYLVASGELLFIRVNGNPEYVGRCSLFDGHAEQVFFNDHVMRVRLKAGLDGGYLAFFLNRSEGKREVAKHRKTSAGQHTINQEGLGSILLPVPPLELQKAFLYRLAEIRKLSASHNASLTELDALFGSVQQSAFRGEI